MSEAHPRVPRPRLSRPVRVLARSLAEQAPGRTCARTARSWRQYLATIGLAGCLTAMDVLLGLTAFMFVSVTFITIVKASSPCWQLVFGLLLGLEEPRLELLGVVRTHSCDPLCTPKHLSATPERRPHHEPSGSRSEKHLPWPIMARCGGSY